MASPPSFQTPRAAGPADDPRVDLRDFLAPVRPELDGMNEAFGRALEPDFEDLLPLVTHVGRYRGKQLRGALALLAGKALGACGTDHLQVAMIVEMIHTATLVHDDILDGATMRRSLSTLNVLYGNEVPVLLGDYIYARAFNLSLRLADQTCSRVLSETTRKVCQGEITQVLHREDLDLGEDLYMRIIGDKTASLYGASSQLGAHYAGAGPEETERLRRFGHGLGLAFQIVDDCLDLEGEESEVGKSLGTDLEGGKPTLPLIHLLRTLPEDRRTGLVSLLRQRGGQAGHRAALARDYSLEEGLRYAHGRAARLVEEALSEIEDLPPSESLAGLRGLARYVLSRRR